MATMQPLLINGSGEVRASTGGQALFELLITGGATWFLLPACWLLEQSLGLDRAELAVGFVAFHAATLINDPHFAVTYLLFYKDLKSRARGNPLKRPERVRYWIAGFLVPLVLVTWSVLALVDHSAGKLGLLFEVMFLLVGWHYVKQGFGVLSVLSARRGVFWSSFERKVVLAHCYCGWAYAWANPSHGAEESSEKGVIYTSVARPAPLELLTLCGLVVSTLALFAVLLGKWRRERRCPPLVPLSGLLVTIWVWSIYSSLDPLLVYVIPALHSLQYLYFVWLLKRNEAREISGPPSFQGTVRQRLGVLAFSAVALGWLLFGGLPSFLDSNLLLADPGSFGETGSLGATPFLAAIVTSVNIHHYFMDNVIWRRDNPEARYLQHA